MNTIRISRVLSFAFALGLAFLATRATPEDIDIFAVDDNNVVARPNILIVLDNSANWSRQSQQWPGTEQQGQAEVSAIKQAITGLDDSVNIGLLEFITGGNASDADSGYVRAHIRPMTPANKTTLFAKLDKIYADINTPEEKRPSSNPFGNLLWDTYNYLGGFNHSNGGTGTPASLASVNAYTTQYSRFNSPLTSADTCTRTVVIFIGNNVSAGPSSDSTANVDALKALAGGGAAGTAAVAQIPFADYAVTTSAAQAKLGYSTACFSSASSCGTAANTTACTDQGFTSCACDATDSVACPSTHWNVVGSNTTSSTSTVSGPASSAQAGADTGDIIQSCKTAGQGAALNPTICPAASDVTQANTPVAGQSTRTQISWASCSYVDIGAGTCNPSSKHNYQKQGTKTTTVTVTQTNNSTSQTTLGQTAACYNDAATCSTTGFNCSGYNAGCACTTTASTTGCAAGNTSRYQILGNYMITSATQTGTFHTAPSGPFMLDEWARFLRQTGVPIPGGSGVRTQVTTYAIDVFNAQQHPDFSALLFNAARVGGGKYFQAKDKNALVNALKQIFSEVQSVNSAFSSASLPVNATNRAQNENQVFIGVFKPDRTKRPLWFGNLKRYQIISNGSMIDLGGANGVSAINNNTGFITDCALSFWTVDSTFNNIPYWSVATSADPLPQSTCTTSGTSPLSDSPDGPFVEKGAAAEVLRRGNNPASSPDGSGNFLLSRTVLTKTGSTAAGGAFSAFNTTTSGLPAATVNFILGQDDKDEDVDSNLTEPRSTIHGDVVHSRPQPINYGGSTGIVVYYGSNDGVYRAVKASNGQELWSFIAPEHYTKLDRLFKDDPPVRFFGDNPIGTAVKDYFFDGSTGFYETFNSDNTAKDVWIYPSMRRGGTLVYGINVSTPASPKYLWSKGCTPGYASCDTGFSAIGQTWSQPNVALIKGYSTTAPVVIFGGGYDPCDDDNSKTPCAASKGRGVYVLDAQTGTLLKYFDFSSLSGFSARGVAADVASVDIDNDHMVDYVYAADTGGNIYRMDFIDGPTTKVAQAASSWTMSRVAYTNGAYRKFLFPPTLVQASATQMYLALGTGDREHPLMSQYPYGTEGALPSASDGPVLNRFYVFKDSLADVDVTTKLNLDDSSTMNDYSSNQNCSATKITPSSSKAGWFKSLNSYGQGEQTVTSAAVVAGFVVFSTNRPTSPATAECSTSLGEARGYFMNLFNASGAIAVNGAACGGRDSSIFVGGGLPPSPVLATVPVNGRPTTVLLGAVDESGGVSTILTPQPPQPPISSRRNPIYWYKSSGEK